MPTLHTPADEVEAADLIRRAAAERAPFELCGGGTRLGLGRPIQAAATLSSRGLSGVTLYEPGALTLVARAGTPLAEIEAALAAERQQLAFEPMDHRALFASAGASTIGGVVAANVSGPRRIQAGACRDSLLGVRFVTGEGEIVKNGGRVMKNVTGYDLVKLLCGAYGTLGFLTEVSLKVAPRPEAAATVLAHGLDDAAAVAALSDALGSPYDVTGAAHLPAAATVDGAAAVTMLRLEGLAGSVAHRASALRARLARFGAIEIVDDARVAAGWAYVRDAKAFAGKPGAVWRLSLRPSRAAAAVAALAAEIELAGHFYDWGGGLVWLRVAETGDAGAAAIRAAARAAGGHATLVRAPDALRAAVAPFTPEHPRLARLSQELRARFDPSGVLNPGRLAA